MSAAARETAAPYSIASVSRNHVLSFQQMLKARGAAPDHPVRHDSATA
jgi:hypothetical protein